MENYVIDLLRSSGADAWTVADECRTGWEFYFIRHRLDQNRARDTEHITLTVYKRFGEGEQQFLGSASAENLSPAVQRLLAAFGGPEAQRRLLEAEGVAFLPDGRVDMARFGVFGSEEQ